MRSPEPSAGRPPAASRPGYGKRYSLSDRAAIQEILVCPADSCLVWAYPVLSNRSKTAPVLPNTACYTPKVLTTSYPHLPQSVREPDLANCVQQDVVQNKCKRDCDVKVAASFRFILVKEGPI